MSNFDDLAVSRPIAVGGNEEPITIEALWKFYTEAKIVPMRFKPTGEVIDVTLQFRDQLEKVKEKYTPYDLQ